MGKVTVPHARCQNGFDLLRVGKASELHLTKDDVLIYWQELPIAVISGGFIYYHVPSPSAAITRLIDGYANDGARSRPCVALSAADFDFTVGSLLTRVGLSLTRAPSQP